MAAIHEDDEWKIDLDAIARSMRVEATPAAPPSEPVARVERPPPRRSRRIEAICFVSVAIAIGVVAILEKTRTDIPPPTVASARPIAPTETAAPAPSESVMPSVSPSPSASPNPTGARRASTIIDTRRAAPSRDDAQPRPLTIVDIPETPASPADANLGLAMKDAVGKKDDGAALAEPARNGSAQVHIRPPAGAVNAAVSVAVAKARVCMPAGLPAGHATIVFAASGEARATVRDVAIPEIAACVASELSAARIEPFVEAPYSVSVTVRP
jgi:hypothetical protein